MGGVKNRLRLRKREEEEEEKRGRIIQADDDVNCLIQTMESKLKNFYGL